MQNTEDIHGPILVLVRGLPGSGKTYLANTLQTMLGADKVVLLDPDAIDRTGQEYQNYSKTLTSEGIEELFHPYRYLRAGAHRAIESSKIIIWSQPFTLPGGFERTIQNLHNFAAERDIDMPILSVEIEVDPILAKSRVSTRKQQGGHGPSDGRFARFVSEYTSLPGSGQDRTLTLHGEDNATTSAVTVLETLRELSQHPEIPKQGM